MNFLIQLKCNAIVKWHFCYKLEHNLTSTIEITRHYANAAFFVILGKKKGNNLLEKVDIYQNYD